jgi:dienelactone hydrolase
LSKSQHQRADGDGCVARLEAIPGAPARKLELAAKIALIGYCFGGAVGVEFGATGAPLVANVSIHGSFRDHEAGWAKNARGMYLILHGAEDQSYPLTAVDRVIQELRAWKVPFQLEVYSGTGHGFSTPKRKAEERANAQSIASTARTLKELFGI